MKRRGTGVGSMFYGVGNTGLPNPAAAFVEVLPDTSVNVTVGAADIGRGSSTMAATIAAETLGLEFENIHVTWADTQIAPEGGATSASRQTFITGNAAKNACMQAMGELKKTASELLNVPEEDLIFRHREAYSKARSTLIPMTNGQKMRNLFAEKGFIVAPGCHDALTAKPKEFGYNLVIYPTASTYVTTKAMIDLWEGLKRDDTTETMIGNMVPFAQFNELMGLQKIRDIEHTYASSTGR